MPTRSTAGLKNALEQAARRPGPPAVTAGAGEGKAAGTREGKIHVGAWLPEAFKTSLRMIQVKSNRSLQQLTAEAFNDLFAKYDVPTVGDERP